AAYYQENGPGTYHKLTLLDRLSQFGLEGYWSLLLGQKVPYQRLYVPNDRERETWRQIQQAFRAKGEAGVSVKEALAIVRSPAFRGPETFKVEQLFELSFGGLSGAGGPPHDRRNRLCRDRTGGLFDQNS